MPNRLSELVDSSAEQYTSYEAFRCLNESITYEELALRTNRIANFLIGEGVKRGDRVGVFLPRCLESATAVHGILKAGAAFVPIDPNSPVSRLRSILIDCGVRHLITNKAKYQNIVALLTDSDSSGNTTPHGLDCILGFSGEASPDGEKHVAGETKLAPSLRLYDWNVVDQQPVHHPSTSENGKSSDLAYVMYTSGSTGQPKGIMHTHESGHAYAELSRDLYRVGVDDVIANHSPLHFDMSTFGYLTAPLAGATTSIIPAAYTKFPASLSQLVQDHGISIWYSVPYALIQMVTRGACENRDHERLRWILFGGEPFPTKHLRAAMNCWPKARFSNVYGPAEVNQCTYFHLPKKWPEQLQDVPIGKVWDRTEALIVDELGAESEEGELLIASPTRMKGYWGRADLTEKAFYNRPKRSQMDDSSSTFYRTGDLVRIQPDGNLSFLGRKDRQVKLRGHRIELDEVEAAFAAHEDVEHVGAYPITRDGEVVQIGVSILARKNAADSNSASFVTIMRQFVATQLPPYAVPAKITCVDILPRTTSGKIDRRSLQIAAEQGHSNSDIPNEN